LDNNNAFFKLQTSSKSELVEYDFDHSGQLTVLGLECQRESLLFYEGSVWYKQSFDYAKPAQGRLFLHFGAANYLADVYLNAKHWATMKAGSHLLILRSRTGSIRRIISS